MSLLLKKTLREMEWSQGELARALGVTRQQINQLVLGRDIIGMNMAVRLEKILKVPAEDFLAESIKAKRMQLRKRKKQIVST